MQLFGFPTLSERLQEENGARLAAQSGVELAFDVENVRSDRDKNK